MFFLSVIVMPIYFGSMVYSQTRLFKVDYFYLKRILRSAHFTALLPFINAHHHREVTCRCSRDFLFIILIEIKFGACKPASPYLQFFC